MITLLVAKYLFYLWLVIFIILSLFDEKRKYSANKIFIYSVGFLLWVLYEIHAYLNGSFSFLGFLGLSLNLIMIFVGFLIIKDKDKEERNFGYVWIGVWTLILIYILS